MKVDDWHRRTKRIVEAIEIARSEADDDGTAWRGHGGNRDERLRRRLLLRLRLTLFLTDGRIELTNNRVERELRALVLGRKNWLSAYGDLGCKRTATILTVLGTCIAHRINPRAYLHSVAKLIVHGFPNERLRDLLPDRITLLHPELRLPTRTPRPPPSLPAPS